MTNWYRASPLKVADVGVPIDVLPALPLEKLKVHCDHLLIWGMNDTALLPQTTQELEDHCAQLKRVEIEDADHWILHQKPVEVADTIIDWVIGDDFYIP
jgi:pimeloyl-ACP methyl ester carboxylesterase